MDFDFILAWLASSLPIAKPVLIVLGSLCVAGTIYVAATPNKEDDAFLQKLESIPVLGWLLVALRKFSVIQPKPPQA